MNLQMSERDDNELQERIESLTLSLKEEYRYGTEEAVLIYEAELRSLTRLCEARDRLLFEFFRAAYNRRLHGVDVETLWQLREMQTWEDYL